MRSPVLVGLSLGIAAGICLAMCAEIVRGDPWTEVPRPSGGYYASAMRAGHQWLYAAWCVPTGTTVGLFRTPISSPGVWENLGLHGHPIHDLLLIGANDDTVFVAANSDTCVYRSFNGGHAWQKGDAGLSIESAHALAMGTERRLLVEGRAVGSGSELRAYSDDLGQTWTAVGSTFVVNYKPFLVSPCVGPQVFFETVYGGSWTSFVHRSTDGGTTFPILPGEYGTFSHDLDVRPADPQYVTALMGGTTMARWSGSTHLADWVTPWTAVGAELPAWDPGRFYLAGLDAQGKPVASWREWEGGAWNGYSEGLPATGGQGVMNQWLSFHLAAAADLPVLFFATKDHGLWARTVNELPSDVGANRTAVRSPRVVFAAPNPAAGVTWLRAAGVTRFEVYAPTGRLVRSLTAKGTGSAAERTSETRALWDGLDESGRMVPPGVYFVRGRPGEVAGRLLRVR